MVQGGNKYVSIVGRGHSQCVSEAILECWGNEAYADVVFVCNKGLNGSGKKLLANKAILAASSKKLASLLSSAGEDEVVTILVPEQDFPTMDKLLRYIYSGEVIVNQMVDELRAFISEWEIASPEVVSLMRNSNTSQTVNVQEFDSLLSVQDEDHPALTDFSAGFSKNKLVKKKATAYPQKKPLSQTNTTKIQGGEAVKGGIKQMSADGSSSGLSTPKPKPKRIRPPRSQRPTAPEIASGYAFLDAYLQTPTKAEPADDQQELETENSLKKPESENAGGTLTSLVDDWNTDAQSDVAQEENSPPKPKRKKVERKKSTEPLKRSKQSDVEKDSSDSEEDGAGLGEDEEGLEPDCEEDEADLFLAKAFYDDEKLVHQDLFATATDYRKAIERVKLYLKHFFGTETMETTAAGPTKVVRIPCSMCNDKLIHPDYLLTHLLMHGDERPFLCDQCGRSFVLQDQLNKHIKKHTEDFNVKPFVCTECDRPFRKAEFLKRHMTLHSGEKPFSCPYCDKTFRLQGVCRNHIRTHTGERPYECEICHHRFAKRYTYVMHLRTHNKTKSRTYGNLPGGEMRECGICGLTFRRESAYLTHVATHEGIEPKLPCYFCPETFGTKKLQRDHLRNEHADQMFHCDQCPSMFTRKETLSSHILTHSRQVTLPCDICNKGFKNKTLLELHRSSVHAVDRPYKCLFPNCEKSYKSKLSLRLHARIHSDIRPYKCTYCPKAFRFYPHLLNHTRTHTGEKPFVCQYCGKAFAIKNNMTQHIQIHEGNKNMCNVCGQTFRSIVKLREHESNHPPMEEHEEELVEEDDEEEEGQSEVE